MLSVALGCEDKYMKHKSYMQVINYVRMSKFFDRGAPKVM